jgi:signal transduction histidine kinase
VRTALFLLLLAAVIGSGLVFIVLLRRLKAAREEERRLTEINAARDEFVSIVSHELRTPVAGVLGFLETTIDHWDSMDEGERKGAVLRAVSNARRLQALARDVLDMERIDAADMPFAPEIVDVVAKVREAVSDLSGAEPDRPITVSLPEGPVYAAVDEGQFFQVMANLVDNAFKNSPVTEPVEVSVAADDGAVVVTVTDHGPGIPDIDRQRVFDKFARGRSTTRGTGLGLYICRQIVERHGGTISADGVEGEGAAISFRIPLAPQPVAAP